MWSECLPIELHLFDSILKFPSCHHQYIFRALPKIAGPHSEAIGRTHVFVFSLEFTLIFLSIFLLLKSADCSFWCFKVLGPHTHANTHTRKKIELFPLMENLNITKYMYICNIPSCHLFFQLHYLQVFLINY